MGIGYKKTMDNRKYRYDKEHLSKAKREAKEKQKGKR
jgi:hypothetical protein